MSNIFLLKEFSSFKKRESHIDLDLMLTNQRILIDIFFNIYVFFFFPFQIKYIAGEVD